MELPLLRARAEIIRNIRAFFDRRGYLEADTPVLSPTLIPETCLEVFATERVWPPGSRLANEIASGRRERDMLYLVPSPEIYLKRLIAKHRVDVYEICHSFRNSEQQGRWHSNEFTMLEYYTMNADYLDSLRVTEELFQDLTQDPQLRPPFLRMTMDEVFKEYAGFSLGEILATDHADSTDGNLSLRSEAVRLGLDLPSEISDAAIYDLIFIHAVEPNLPKDRVVALLDYPAIVPCLAQLNPDGITRQRWELYANGIELANCYSEETDPDAVRAYFENEGREKDKTALAPHRIDNDYWQTFKNFPRCSGVAMGVDRLVMALTGQSTIDAVR
jgi:lysyl-tRNA synthetase class 2